MLLSRAKRKVVRTWNKYKHLFLLPFLILIAFIYSYAVIYGGIS